MAMRLTLRTLLAYLDDTLEPHEARDLGLRVSQSDYAKELVERIKKAARRRGLSTPNFATDGDVSDPNTVAEYLSDALSPEQVERVEENCLTSDSHLAEIAACHQILTLVLTEPVRVPPTANRRMYKLVRRPASLPDRAPGRSLPIGQPLPTEEPPEAQEEDAALLLGMRRYTPGGPLGGRLFQAALVGGLMLCLIIAIVMAMPERSSRGPLIGSGIVLATAPAPKPVVTPAVLATPPLETAKEKPPAPPVVLAVDQKLAPPPRLMDGAAMAKPQPPAPPPLPPREVRKALGRLEAPEQVVVVAKSPQGVLFERLTAAEPSVMSSDSIVVLPGYKAKVRLNSGVVVDLWANTPEQFPNSVFETRVRFHEPPEAVDADLTLISGRIFLTTTKAGSAKVRLRIASEVWDVSLADDRSEALVEVVSTLDAGVPFIKDAKDSPRVSAAFAITKGTVGLNMQGFKDFGTVAGPRFYIWDNKANGIEESNDRNRLDYFTRFPLLPPDPTGVQQSRASAMQKTLSELASTLIARDGLKTRMAEILSDEADFTPLNREIAARHAVYAAAAVDAPVYLVDALNSGLKPFLRSAATFALERWLPLSGDNSALLHQQLLSKQIKEESAQEILRLLRHLTPADLRRPAVLDGLVSLMESGEIPAVRELAFWTLVTAVDPASLENPRLSRFDAAGSQAERDLVVGVWKQRLVELKKRLADEKN